MREECCAYKDEGERKSKNLFQMSCCEAPRDLLWFFSFKGKAFRKKTRTSVVLDINLPIFNCHLDLVFNTENIR